MSRYIHCRIHSLRLQNQPSFAVYRMKTDFPAWLLFWVSLHCGTTVHVHGELVLAEYQKTFCYMKCLPRQQNIICIGWSLQSILPTMYGCRMQSVWRVICNIHWLLHRVQSGKGLQTLVCMVSRTTTCVVLMFRTTGNSMLSTLQLSDVRYPILHLYGLLRGVNPVSAPEVGGNSPWAKIKTVAHTRSLKTFCTLSCLCRVHSTALCNCTSKGLL